MAATPQSSLSLIGFDVSTAAIMSETPIATARAERHAFQVIIAHLFEATPA
jgi:hypothetical protein